MYVFCIFIVQTDRIFVLERNHCYTSKQYYISTHKPAHSSEIFHCNIVLVMNITETLLCIGEGSLGSYRQSSSLSPWLADRGAISMGEGKRVIIRKAWPWIIVSNVFRECHAPCTQKTSFVDFRLDKLSIKWFVFIYYYVLRMLTNRLHSGSVLNQLPESLV